MLHDQEPAVSKQPLGACHHCSCHVQAIVTAAKEVGFKVPLVVRLEGTNVEKGKAIINESDLDVIAADDLNDAAEKIVAAVKKAG